MILGIFHSFPIFLELTLLWQKTLFSIFLSFRDPNDVQMTYKFKGIIFLEGIRRRSEGGEKVEARRPKGIGPRGQIIWPRGTPQNPPRTSFRALP